MLCTSKLRSLCLQVHRALELYSRVGLSGILSPAGVGVPSAGCAGHDVRRMLKILCAWPGGAENGLASLFPPSRGRGCDPHCDPHWKSLPGLQSPSQGPQARPLPTPPKAGRPALPGQSLQISIHLPFQR